MGVGQGKPTGTAASVVLAPEGNALDQWFVVMDYSFSGTLCTTGAALPYAIGAQLAHRDRPVIAFTGDGSLSMGMGELATLAQYDLPVKVVVLHNNSLALEV